MGDKIFDKVFRGVYEKEIRDFEIGVIKKEYKAEFEKLRKKHAGLKGKHNSILSGKPVKTGCYEREE